jgi:hypothetical protein
MLKSDLNFPASSAASIAAKIDAEDVAAFGPSSHSGLSAISA